MRIQICNWGPVGKCEFDLQKNLSVVYGENNIGKSYAMQVLYLLIKKLLEYISRSSIMYYSAYGRNYYNDPIVLQVVSDFTSDEHIQEKNITEAVLKLFAKRLEREWLPEWLNSLENTFGTFSKILDEKPCIFIENENSWRLVVYLQEQKIDVDMQMKPVYLKRSSSDFHKSRNCKDRFDIYVYNNKVDIPIQLIIEREREIEKYFAFDMRKTAGNVYFLPASRSGMDIGMNSLGPILAQLSQNRASFKGGIQIPSIPEPISDYYIELSSIKSDRYEHFTELASEIEDRVLKGEVSFDNKKKTIIYSEKKADYSLEMSDVSSMVSEISPVTAYLKYIIRKERTQLNREGTARKSVRPVSILFIEEPEAHLHPKNQVELIKIFVKLAKENVKLIMASHSNYIFNALNNLILGKELDVDMYAPVFMSREEGKSFTRYMQADELGVSDENFTDTAEMLYQEREELIQRLMQEMEQDNQG